MIILIKLLVLLGALQACLAVKILCVVNMPAKSHAILFDRLLETLASRGHDVTHVTPFPSEKKIPNIKEISLDGVRKFLMDKMEMDPFEMRHMGPVDNLFMLSYIGLTMAERILDDPQIQKLLTTEKYDIVLGEGFLAESILAAFSHKTGAKIIALGTFMPNFWVNYMVGNPAPSAYIPDPFLGYPTRMTFKERLINFVFGVVSEMYHTLFYLEKQDALLKKYIGNDTPHLTDIIKNTSLVLVNHHYSLGYPRAYLPNMVEIGSIQVVEPKPLPPDLKKFMDEAKEGVILFSLGSNLQSSLMPKGKLEIFLKAFSRLKQKVLWKFEADNLPDQPKNVKISKWLPQSDILGHPNLKLFITHGGLLSTTEAVHRGVPIVGIPIFGDQPMNMKYAEQAGLGKALSFDSMTSDSLVSAVEEVLGNPSYRAISQHRSKLLKDTPLDPLTRAVYWVEYVARYDGAPHLKSAAQDLTWYQFYLFDVMLVLAVAGGLALLLPIITIRFLLRRLFNKSNKNSTNTKKKKN